MQILVMQFTPRHSPVLRQVRDLLVLAVFLATGLGARTDSGERIAPPVAKAVPHEMTKHGHTRIDNYYWMRDDTRTDPEVLGYLEAENAYLDKVLAHTEPMRKKLYEEMAARIDPADRTVPVRLGRDWYYESYDAGRDYPIIVRRKGSESGPEEVALDGNERAARHEFYDLGDWEVSEDGNLLAFAEDTMGREMYSIYIKDLRTGKILDREIAGNSPYLAWANDNRTLFYIRLDEALRPNRVFRHALGDDLANDRLAYDEKDQTFDMGLEKSRSRQFIIITLVSTLSTENRLIDADRPTEPNRAFLPREPDHRYMIEPAGEVAWVRSNWQADNYRLLRVPLASSADKSAWEEVIPGRDSVSLYGFLAFDRYVAVNEVHAGTMKLRILSVDGATDHYVESDEAAYTAIIDNNPNMDTDLLRYAYTSLATPETTWDYDMTQRCGTQRKQEFAGKDFRREALVTSRIYAPARDGEQVPVTLLYRKGVKPDGTNPLFLLGYGAYSDVYYPEFVQERLSLVNRGFVFALAHIRGGGEYGRRWYDHGRMLNKKNTFYDFIDSAKHLVASGWAAKDKVAAMGRSAGGLLIGSVANMSPETFTVLITEVPFVDPVTTMLDDTIPLTSFEWDEWGNPKIKEQYDYMLSYSPIDQVKAMDYPHMMATTSLWDARVQYFEPAKWVAKLRTLKTDENLLLFHTDMSAGHAGSHGRYEALEETAMEYAFIFDLFGFRN